MYSGLTPHEMHEAGCWTEVSARTTFDATILDIQVKIPTAFLDASRFPSWIVEDAIAQFVSVDLLANLSTTNLMGKDHISSTYPRSNTMSST